MTKHSLRVSSSVPVAAPQLILVRPMRYLAAVTIIICCVIGVREAVPAAGKQLPPATRAYNDQISAIAEHAIHTEFAKHSESLSNFSVKLRYNVDRDGHIRDVRIVSRTPDGWAEKTAARTLAATKFPPIPKNVLQELGMDHLEAQLEFTSHVDPSQTRFTQSSYDDYDLRVHRILETEVKPAFSAQSHRLEVDYEFYLDPKGRVVSLKTHAKAGGQWAEQTIARSVRTLKFPSVPPQVFKDLKQKPPLKIYGTMSWDPR